MLLVIIFTLNGSKADPVIADGSSTDYLGTKMPELEYYQNYDDLKNNGKSAVIYPIFTQSAYEWGGLHDYYSGYCDYCTSARLHHEYEKTFSSSGNGFRILEFLGYQVLDDADIDKNTTILDQFDKVVVLHNEFVTKKEFDAIMQHPNVIYLYPNALTSQITVDYDNNLVSLVQGPSYPTDNIKNGFDWQEANSQYNTDWECNSWEFYKINNGYMLNCYPETFLPNNGYEMLKKLQTL
jgi:hypothetical protein